MTTPLRRLRWPALTSLAMVVVMLGLGIWQLERARWKRELLNRIDRAEATPGTALSASPQPFAKVRIQGRLRHTAAGYYGADVQLTPAGPKMGARLIVPLDRPQAPPVLVDRGWVPIDSDRPIFRPEGEVTIEGYVRLPESARWFSATDDVRARRFYTLDPLTIGAALGVPDVEPFVVVVLAPRPNDMFPIPAQSMPRPPNNHLGYAGTWFALAFILVVIFVLHARTVLRQ